MVHVRRAGWSDPASLGAVQCACDSLRLFAGDSDCRSGRADRSWPIRCRTITSVRRGCFLRWLVTCARAGGLSGTTTRRDGVLTRCFQERPLIATKPAVCAGRDQMLSLVDRKLGRFRARRAPRAARQSVGYEGRKLSRFGAAALVPDKRLPGPLAITRPPAQAHPHRRSTCHTPIDVAITHRERCSSNGAHHRSGCATGRPP